MKNTLTSTSTSIAGLFAGCVLLTSASSRAAESYENVRIGDITYANVTVVKTNALEVIVLFQGGGGAALKRADLPEPLRSRHPYDPEAAAALERARAANAKAWREQAHADAYVSLLRKEQATQTAIAKAEREMVELQKEINVRAHQAKGRRPNHPSRIEVNQLRERKIGLNRQIERLNQELAANRAWQAQYR